MLHAVAELPYEQERGKPMPDLNHSMIQLKLILLLSKYYGEKYLPLPELKIDVKVRDRVPDVCIYPPMLFDPSENQISMSEPPLGAIEIISEMQSPNVLIKKRTEYFAVGVKSYWFVMPTFRTIYVYSSEHDFEVYSKEDMLLDKILGIKLSLKEVFAPKVVG